MPVNGWMTWDGRRLENTQGSEDLSYVRKVEIGDCVLYCGDCLSVMPELEDNSIDSVVCDPPYELGFMGKAWDSTGIAYNVNVWRECLRILKPGGYLLAFGGSRTYHRLACAVEDAGFEIRDQIQWVYGSGFPKSLDVSKAIDKAAGAKREVVGRRLSAFGTNTATGGRVSRNGGGAGLWAGSEPKEVLLAGTPATPEAIEWDGWGTALKPAHEPIVMARKPLSEPTVAANVLRWGTGAINVDGCRVPMESEDDAAMHRYNCEGGYKRQKNWHLNDLTKGTLAGGWKKPTGEPPAVQGRFPANLIHDGSDEVVSLFPQTGTSSGGRAGHTVAYCGGFRQEHYGDMKPGFGDSGSAARFFYVAKASKADRDEGLEGLQEKITQGMRSNAGPALVGEGRIRTQVRNNHPTVKPTALMAYLCRLITPPGGIVFDPFAGSGSTGKAAGREGFRFWGIELDEQYFDIACRRIEEAYAKKQQELIAV